MTANAAPGAETHRATVLVSGRPEDDARIRQLCADPGIEVIDRLDEQRAELRLLQPPPEPALTDEPPRWVHYPWRRAIVALAGPQAFRRLRFDRNRNLITDDEQQRLGRLRVGVIGLSVGHVIAHTLAAQGVCGELRLCDFDHLEIPNLNRVPATVLDQGVNKAVVAARRIAELDPYLPVEILTAGITADTVGGFLDGLDILVEECDSLDTKVLVREAARARQIPVLMTTSDRALLDVERFDLDASRPLLHGLLGDITTAQLQGLTNSQKVPYALRLLDGAAVSARMAASLVEVGQTLTTWPQLAAEVVAGAAMVAEAVRRIGVGEPLPSGRLRVDALGSLDRIRDPLDEPPHHPQDCPQPMTAADDNALAVMAAAASRAPSGGNTQPWQISTESDSVTIRIATELTSTMDLGFRASAVAVGAAVFNARVAAAAIQGCSAQTYFDTDTPGTPLRATVRPIPGAQPHLARLYGPMLARSTNRHHGTFKPIDDAVVEAMTQAAAAEGAHLTVLRQRPQIEQAAAILGAADRIRYLTAHLHAEMFSELRWPGDPSPDTGIDVLGLELEPADLVKLDVLRRPEVMAYLARWGGGEALAESTRERVAASSGIAVVTMTGRTLVDYARAGSAVEAIWIAAEENGLAVQPVSPAFLYAHDDDDLQELSAPFIESLRGQRNSFRTLVGTPEDQAQALVLRLALAPPPSVPSRRRVLP